MEHVTDDCTCEGKKCIGCQKVKCFGYFTLRVKARGVRLGNIHSYCRSCDGKRGGEAIRLSRIENAAQWNKNHPEEARNHRRKWRKNNPDKAREATRRWEEEHPTSYFTPEYNRTRYQRWKNEQPESYRARNKAVKANRRARKAHAPGSYTQTQWLLLKSQYNYTCLRCSRSEPEIKLTPDHIVPLSRGGSNDISNIQPLCHSCNSSKGTKTIDFRPKYA